jgi:hypothetical protein
MATIFLLRGRSLDDLEVQSHRWLRLQMHAVADRAKNARDGRPLGRNADAVFSELDCDEAVALWRAG